MARHCFMMAGRAGRHLCGGVGRVLHTLQARGAARPGGNDAGKGVGSGDGGSASATPAIFMYRMYNALCTRVAGCMQACLENLCC